MLFITSLPINTNEGFLKTSLALMDEGTKKNVKERFTLIIYVNLNYI